MRYQYFLNFYQKFDILYERLFYCEERVMFYVLESMRSFRRNDSNKHTETVFSVL